MKNMWLYWDVFRRIREMGRSGVCGELCSLRFTWQRPGRSASAEEEFLYGSLVQYLCLAEDLAGSNLKKLYIVKAAGRNNLFALAEFENIRAVCRLKGAPEMNGYERMAEAVRKAVGQ